jgi:hypothetical protein
MWNVIVTLATVGYGDFYLKTGGGRIVGLVVSFWGTFVVSYFVVTVTSMLTFAPPEEKSYTLLLRLHYKEELKRYAVNVLSSAFRHKAAKLKYELDEASLVTAANRKFRANTLQFQQAASLVRIYSDNDGEMDMVMKLIDSLRDDIQLLKDNQIRITDNIEKLIGFVRRIELHTMPQEEEETGNQSSSSNEGKQGGGLNLSRNAVPAGSKDRRRESDNSVSQDSENQYNFKKKW